MKDFETMDREQDVVLEQRITSALERRPQVVVPKAFAERMVHALPVPTVRGRLFAGTSVSAGKTASMVAALLLAAALFVLAPHAGPSFSNVAFDAELLVLAELAAVVCGLARMLDGRL